MGSHFRWEGGGVTRKLEFFRTLPLAFIDSFLIFDIPDQNKGNYHRS